MIAPILFLLFGGIISIDLNLQISCYLFDDNSAVHHYHFLSWLNLLVKGRCWRLSYYFSHIILVKSLLNYSLYTFTLLRSSALSPLCIKCLQWMSNHDTTSNKRNRFSDLSSFLVHTEAVRLCLHFSIRKKTGATKPKFRTSDHNSSKYKHAWADLKIWRKGR